MLKRRFSRRSARRCHPLGVPGLLRMAALLVLGAVTAAPAAERASVQELIAKVRAEFPGEVLRLELEEDETPPHYEVRVLAADGHVLKLTYDASTLELLEVKGRCEGGDRGHHAARRDDRDRAQRAHGGAGEAARAERSPSATPGSGER